MNTDSHRRFRPRLRAATGLGVTFAVGVAALAGCAASSDASGASSEQGQTSSDTRPDSVQAVIDANSDQTVVNDDEWSADDAQDVELTGDGADTEAAGVSAADGTVTISEAGVYRLTGELDGQVVIDADEDAQVVLILDGVTIDADGVPGISSVVADDVALSLADGSENTVSSTGTYDEDAEPNAAIFADNDLTVSGSGSLTVNGEVNDGITSKDDLVVLSGTISVTATDDGLRGKDSLTVRGGDITVDAGGDGLMSDQDDDETKGWTLIEGGTLDIEAGSDGIDGFSDAVVTGGDIRISSEEGIEAGIVGITAGTIDITATDDGINGSAGSSDTTTTTDASDETADAEATDGTDAEGDAQATDGAAQDAPAAGAPADGEMPETSADGEMPEPPADGEMPDGAQPPSGEMPEGEMPQGSQGGMGGGMGDTGEWVLIEGGDVTVDAEGDGLDSNGSLDVSGGTVVVYGPTDSGNGALDANGEITTTGGTLVALDSGGMSETPAADSEQAWVAAPATGEAGQAVEVTDADGAVLWQGEATKAFGAVIVSTADVVADGSYAFAVGGEDSTTAAAAGEALAGGRGGGPQG